VRPGAGSAVMCRAVHGRPAIRSRIRDRNGPVMPNPACWTSSDRDSRPRAGRRVFERATEIGVIRWRGRDEEPRRSVPGRAISQGAAAAGGAGEQQVVAAGQRGARARTSRQIPAGGAGDCGERGGCVASYMLALIGGKTFVPQFKTPAAGGQF